MIGLAGIEIGRERVRAVVRSRGGTLHTYEMPCATERLDEMVAQLSTAAGDVRSIGLAIGLAHLHVKQVKLPPVAHAARKQMLSVEPERWFTVAQGSPTAVSLTPDGDIALAADGAYVDACVRAFSKWAPVQRVEAAPMALARALNAAGHRTTVAAIDDLQKQVAKELEAVRAALADLERQSATIKSEESKNTKASEDLKGRTTAIDKEDNDNLKKMAPFYNSMSPESAAKILKQFADTGKIETAAKILMMMQGKQGSKVLDELKDPVLAAQLLEVSKKLRNPSAATDLRE